MKIPTCNFENETETKSGLSLKSPNGIYFFCNFVKVLRIFGHRLNKKKYVNLLDHKATILYSGISDSYNWTDDSFTPIKIALLIKI